MYNTNSINHTDNTNIINHTDNTNSINHTDNTNSINHTDNTNYKSYRQYKLYKSYRQYKLYKSYRQYKVDIKACLRNEHTKVQFILQKDAGKLWSFYLKIKCVIQRFSLMYKTMVIDQHTYKCSGYRFTKELTQNVKLRNLRKM